MNTNEYINKLVQEAGKVKSLTARVKELETAADRARIALEETNRFNNLGNDLDAYLFAMAEWGMEKLDIQPNPENYGLSQED